MATATLNKRQRKPNAPARRAFEDFDADRSEAFFMPAGSMSLEEFRQWTYADDFPKTGLIAYIGNEIFIDMNPERLVSHGSVKVEICTVLANLVRKKKIGKFLLDRTRFVHPSAEVSNEPDAFFAAWETLKKGKLRRIATASGDDCIEVEGTPDWIMEIVSPRSVTKDTKKLRKRYHLAGIREYWLIDARGKEVGFEILVHGDEDFEPSERDGEWQMSKVFGKKFRFYRIKDELGDVDYRLDMK